VNAPYYGWQEASSKRFLDVSLARRPCPLPLKQAPITALPNGADENRLDD